MAAATFNEHRHYDTIVIGAGMSGLSCAAKLFQHHHYKHSNRLLVLEGRDRIGGRIGAVNVEGSRLDTGANWIHGVGTADRPNPLMRVLPHKKIKQLSGMVAFQAPSHKPNRVRDKIEPDQSPDDEWVHVPRATDLGDALESKPDTIIPNEIAEVLMGSVWGLIGSLHEIAAHTPDAVAKHTTVLRALIKSGALRNAYSAIPEEYHHTLSGMPQFLEGMEAAPLVPRSAEHAESRPGMSLSEFAIDDFDGDQVFLQDGYLAVIEEVATELIGADLIRTGTKVEQIRWDQNPIVIETSQGTYTATQVVCTLPLGVLKHALRCEKATFETLFQPELPAEKQKAIRSLGFGTLDKIFLVYKTAWWEQEPFASVIKEGLVKRPFTSDFGRDVIQSTSETSFDTLLSFTDELTGIEIGPDGSTTPGISALTMVNHANITGYPVLSAFVSCSRAAQVESMTNEQAGGIVHRALCRCWGREVPRAEAVYVTRWSQDEFSRGSYSHMITGVSEQGHRAEFQRPIVSDGAALRFAGEHTSRNHFATVHGALLSGWREADDILRQLQVGVPRSEIGSRLSLLDSTLNPLSRTKREC